MQNEPSDDILAFDTLFTTNHMQILKTLLPYTESDARRKLAIYIKFQELQYTISHFRGMQAEITSCGISKKEFRLKEFYQKAKGYCTHAEKQQIEQLIQMMDALEMMKNVQEMMDFMKEMEAAAPAKDADGKPDSPSGDKEGARNAASDEGGSMVFELLKGMLSPEQAALFEMMQKKEPE